MYPNQLPEAEEPLYARTDSEATIDIEEVCAAMRERGGFKGDYRDFTAASTSSYSTKVSIMSPFTLEIG